MQSSPKKKIVYIHTSAISAHKICANVIKKLNIY